MSYETILQELENRSLLRRLRAVDVVDGTRLELENTSLINFASNDYLGLSQHAAVREAAIEAIHQFGLGAAASRLITGTLAPHTVLEEQLAAFKGTEAAISFSSGYAAAVGTITAIANRHDVVILDKLAHACLIDGARLSGARLRVFPHNDLSRLSEILDWAHLHHPNAKIWIITESLFSMDGDYSPLRELVELKDEHGANLFLDEAHATGVIGPEGKGLAAHLGLVQRVEVQMGTLSKALGGSGGFIAGSSALIELLINRARSFIFSTAPAAAVVAGVSAALTVVQSAEGERMRGDLRQNIDHLRQDIRLPSDRHLGPVERLSSPIIPLIVGEENAALESANQLQQHGFLVPAIRFPSVRKGSARLRLTLSARHSSEQITALVRSLHRVFTDHKQ
ncbi:MAG: 8-amino-7-oxononanoate synthase [Chthoniobacterales bacterium]